METIIKLILFSSLFFLIACGTDCQDVEIEKVEWVTRYEDYNVDTLVRYSVTEKVKMIEYSGSTTSRDNFTHNVIICNNDKNYSNKFAVKIVYDYYNYWNTYVHQSDYVEISPGSSHEFSFVWSGSYGNKDSDFETSVTVLQEPQAISLKQRIDELKITTDIVNTCSVDVEALKMKYQAIKERYEQLKNEGLITDVSIHKSENDTINLTPKRKMDRINENNK